MIPMSDAFVFRGWLDTTSERGGQEDDLGGLTICDHQLTVLLQGVSDDLP